MLRRTLIAPLALTLALGLAAPAAAAPVCTGAIPKAACGFRTVPEPETISSTYVTFDEFQAALADLAAEFPGRLTHGSLGDSEGGHPILIAEVTNPDSPIAYEDRKVVYIAQSIHGNEVGGREGMIRVIEDLLRATDPETESLLDQLRLVQFVPNSDGWERGDFDRAGSTTYSRGNDNGTDLNRQFPWKGWIPNSRQPVSEPEAAAVVADVEARMEAGEDIVAAGDIHGMGQNQSAVWTMLSSGEFDLDGIVRQRLHGEGVEDAVVERLSPRALYILSQAAGQPVRPHVLTSSSEFQGGLSGSGFLGDWLAQKDGGNAASLSTIELFANQPFHSLQYAKEIVQIHVESVRAIVHELMHQAVTEPEVEVELAGTVGYLHDPLVVEGATPMAFFEDLDPFLSEPLRRIALADVTDPEEDPLDALSTLVVTSDLALGDADAVARIDAWVESGGNLVATDSGLRVGAAVSDGLADGQVTKQNTVISNASFANLGHPMALGVRQNALHLYEPATLGYDSENATQSPVWRVSRSAFDAVGTTIATTSSQTSVGLATEGAGSIHVIGGLLPPPVTNNKHPFGLNDYALTDTGTLLFINAIGGDLLIDGAPADFDTATGAVPASPQGRR